MLDTLACPVDKGELQYSEQLNVLANLRLKLAYDVVDGIPKLLPESGRELTSEELAEFVSQES